MMVASKNAQGAQRLFCPLPHNGLLPTTRFIVTTVHEQQQKGYVDKL
jgi:hypothetical protein